MDKPLTNRQQKSLETKQRIFNSACKLFAEKGFDNVTMEDITSAVGLTSGTFYRHFKTKQEILAIVYANLDVYYQEFYDTVICSEKYRDTSAITRLLAFTEYNMETCVKDGLEFVNVIYRYMVQSTEFERSMNNPDRIYFRIVRSLIKEGQDKGEIRRDLPHETLAFDLAMLTRGCIVDWEMHKKPGSLNKWSETLLKCYFDGIRVKP